MGRGFYQGSKLHLGSVPSTDPETVGMLRHHRDRIEENRKMNAEICEDSGLVVRSKRGKRIRPRGHSRIHLEDCETRTLGELQFLNGCLYVLSG